MHRATSVKKKIYQRNQCHIKKLFLHKKKKNTSLFSHILGRYEIQIKD